jgi:succinyl-diaminopimelate desuccinylase
MATREDLNELVAELVRIETENPPGNERACADFVVEWFEEHGVDATLVHEPYEDRPQAVAIVGEGDPTLVLNGHIDVVPTGDPEQWDHDPYGADIENGHLYGRGSVDMKGGVAVGMLVTATLRESIESGDLSGSIVMQAAIGEETAEPGTKSLLENGYDGDYGVVLEPTGLQTATSEKGLAWYEITVDGDPSHASQPDQGTNAIENARPVLDALADYDKRVRERQDELVGTAYATMTKIQAGTKENVVPESARITVDRRFLPEESIEDIDGEINDLLSSVEENHDTETSWKRTRTYESAAIPEDSYLAEVFRTYSERIAGVDPSPWGIEASTDVRNFVNDFGIEAITWGPGDIEQAHTFDEHLDLEEAYVGYEVLMQAAEDLLTTENE